MVRKTKSHIIGRPPTHGKSRTVEFRIWRGMITRCSNPNSDQYHNYGGRGIKVCKVWRSSFEAFLLDMGQRPSSVHFIERKNNDGDYEPSNCKWATSKEQSRNKRTNRLITIEGETKCMTDWVAQAGIPMSTFYNRIRRGWQGADLLRPIGTILRSHPWKKSEETIESIRRQLASGDNCTVTAAAHGVSIHFAWRVRESKR